MGEFNLPTKKYQKNIVILIYVVLSFTMLFLLFYNLGNVSAENWDEARHGISAYEMLKNKNFIINTYNYEPDLWNLKPPFSFWMESISFSLFGYNLFAFRLPSAIAMFLTFGSISIFLHKTYGYISTISFMLLFQCFPDMILEHCGRNGDADALFMLFFSLAMIFLYYSKDKFIYLYLSGFMFSLTFLNKSFHALTILGIIGLYVIFSGLIKKMRIANYLIMFLSTFSVIIIWAIIRYCYDGLDFLGAMFGVDVVNRATDTTSNGTGLFYFAKYIVNYRATQFIIFIILICTIYLIATKKVSLMWLKRRDFILLVSCVMVTFIIYNLSKSVMSWYFYPTFVALIIISSILINKVLLAFTSDFSMGKARKAAVVATSSILTVTICTFLAFTVKSYYKSEIFNASINTVQKSIIELSENRNKFSNIDAFILKDSNTYKTDLSSWEQADILIAELYGDWLCQDGGTEAFIKNKNKAVYLISNAQYSKNKSVLSKYKIVERNSEYLLLSNM